MYTYFKELPESYLKQILINEGAYQCHPKDSGNYYGGKLYGTNMGVTPGAIMKAVSLKLITLPSSGLTVDYMKKLDRETVRIIYNMNYYKSSEAFLLPDFVALFYVDTAILHGVGGSITLLQKTLNKFSSSKISEDGGMGPQTRKTISEVFQSHQLNDIAKEYMNQRISRYSDIVKADKKKAIYYNGWCNRVNRLLKLYKLK